jgi:saccharopine dehydrogenase (NADP+, L-glutamate forming)
LKNITLLGSGKSSYFLIKTLIDYCKTNNLNFTIYDFIAEFPFNKEINLENTKYISCNLSEVATINQIVSNSHLVISLLPPQMHLMVAKACIEYTCDMITASYLSEDIKKLEQEAIQKGIRIMMESGLDPGIDHMSALKEIESIKNNGGIIKSFYSFTGGLVAPEHDNNPWHYKISWNPKNVATAGLGGAIYKEDKCLKILPYHRLFEQTRNISIWTENDYEVYPNRNSLPYIDLYQLYDCHTMMRGTIRKKGFCAGWNKIIELGMTDDSNKIAMSNQLSFRDFTNQYLPQSKKISTEENLCKLLNISTQDEIFKQIKYLGLLSDEIIKTPNATGAEVLVELLNKNLKMQAQDKDMIMMQHIIDYEIDNTTQSKTSQLIVQGENNIETAMAKTVGLPLAYATEMMIENKINQKGIILPLKSYIYTPILSRLENEGIAFENVS